jgi:hypothetical protein
VLGEIRRLSATSARFIPANEIRRSATRSVAENGLAVRRFKNQNSAERTIHDALIRRLNPDVRTAAEFDNLVDQWIRGRPEALRRLLAARAVTESQRQRIASLLQSEVDRRSEAQVPRRAREVTPDPRGHERRQPPTVQLDPDIQEFFPDSTSVNQALRALVAIIRRAQTVR